MSKLIHYLKYCFNKRYRNATKICVDFGVAQTMLIRLLMHPYVEDAEYEDYKKLFCNSAAILPYEYPCDGSPENVKYLLYELGDAVVAAVMSNQNYLANCVIPVSMSACVQNLIAMCSLFGIWVATVLVTNGEITGEEMQNKLNLIEMQFQERMSI